MAVKPNTQAEDVYNYIKEIPAEIFFVENSFERIFYEHEFREKLLILYHIARSAGYDHDDALDMAGVDVHINSGE